jgi:hemoglobin
MDHISQLHNQLGEPVIRALVAAFYTRVSQDDLIGPMYPPEDLAGAEERLADFLVYRFGGSTRYLETRGHPRLRMRHFPFVITHEAKERWIELMAAAMQAVGIPPAIAPTMSDFFRQVADSMQNHHS